MSNIAVSSSRTIRSGTTDHDAFKWFKNELKNKFPNTFVSDDIWYQHCSDCAKFGIVDSTHTYIVRNLRPETIYAINALPRRTTFLVDVIGPDSVSVTALDVDRREIGDSVLLTPLGFVKLLHNQYMSHRAGCRNPVSKIKEFSDVTSEYDLSEHIHATAPENRISELLFRVEHPVRHVDFDMVLIDSITRQPRGVVEEYRPTDKVKSTLYTKMWAEYLNCDMLDIQTLGPNSSDSNFLETKTTITYRPLRPSCVPLAVDAKTADEQRLYTNPESFNGIVDRWGSIRLT